MMKWTLAERNQVAFNMVDEALGDIVSTGSLPHNRDAHTLMVRLRFVLKGPKNALNASIATYRKYLPPSFI